MTSWQFFIIAFSAFTSSFIKNGTAIGAGVFLMPILAFAFPAKIALAVAGPILLISDLAGLRYYWGEWGDWRLPCSMFLASLAGLAVGAALITVIPGDIFSVGIGVFSISFVSWQLFLMARQRRARASGSPAAKALTPLQDKLFSLGAGAAGGVTSYLAHSGGLIWSIYLFSRLEKRPFIASIMLMSIGTGIIKIVTFLSMGLLQLWMLPWIAACLPLVFLGAHLGNWANMRISTLVFRILVLGIIFIMGLALCVKG